MKFLQNIDRVESFSDAIFAFAATLTVLDFSMNNLVFVGKEFWLNFMSFGISFFVLILLWKTHYNLFRRTDYIDNWIIGLNGFLLFVVLYYQFPLRRLVKTILQDIEMGMGEVSFLFVSYGLGFVLVFLCFSLIYHRNFIKNKKSGNSVVYRMYFRHFLIFVIIGLFSITLSVFKIGLNYGVPGFVYVLLGPFCTWNALSFKKKLKNISSSD